MADTKPQTPEPGCRTELDESLDKTRELVSAVQQIHKLQQEAEHRVGKESKAHAQTKERIKHVQDKHAKVHELHEVEKNAHGDTQRRLEEALMVQVQQQEGFKDQLNELATLKLSNEALKVEIGAQRKAFQVDVNWSGRHAELMKKHAELKKENVESQKKSLELHEKMAELGSAANNLKAKMEELDRFKEAQQAELIRKKAGRGKAMATLEKSLAQGDDGFKAVVLNNWKAWVDAEKSMRSRKDQGMKSAARTIAAAGDALVAVCYNAWNQDVKAEMKRKLIAQKEKLAACGKDGAAGAERARQKAIQALEKSFAQKQGQLAGISFEGWKKVRWARQRAEQNKNGALRGIADSEGAMKAQCYTSWKGLWSAALEKRQQKDGAMQRATRMIAGASQGLLIQCSDAWLALAKKAKAGLAKMAMVERNLLSEGRGLLDLIVNKWGQLIKDKKAKSGNKDKNMQRALRGIAGSNNALLAGIMLPWRKFAEENKHKQRTQDQSMQRAARFINSSQNALLATCVQSWGRLARKSAGQNTRLRVLQRLMGQDARQMVIACFQGWIRHSGTGTASKNMIEELQRQLQGITNKTQELNLKTEEATAEAHEKEQQLMEHRAELEDSRRKARSIKEELEKIGCFVQAKKSSSRPSSGAKHGSSKKSDTSLPPLSARPPSGTKQSTPPTQQAWQD